MTLNGVMAIILQFLLRHCNSQLQLHHLPAIQHQLHFSSDADSTLMLFNRYLLIC